MYGNRTVTLSALECLFPQGGNAVRFFFLFFRCLVQRLVPFFVVPLFLGSLFGNIFGSELLFLGGCVGLVFFGGFLLLFLLYLLAFRSRNCLEKF